MKHLPETQRRATGASSPLPTPTASTSAALSAAVTRMKPVEESGGNATPRQKQRAALRVVSQQGKELSDSVNPRTENSTVMSNDLTITGVLRNGAMSSQDASKREEDGHAAVPTATASNSPALLSSPATVTRGCLTTLRKPSASLVNAKSSFTSSAAPVESTSSATPPTKPKHQHNASPVPPRRHSSRDRALSPRHITVGTTLVTPPPATSIRIKSSPTRSPRGVGATENWASRRNSGSAPQESRHSPGPGPSPMSTASASQPYSSRRCDSEINNSLSSSRSHTAQASLRPDVPRVVRPTPRSHPGTASLLAQQLLDEGYYVASDGSANSSFSDTPRSARPASLGSTPSGRASMQLLELNAGGRMTPRPSKGVATPGRVARREYDVGDLRSSSSSSKVSSHSSGTAFDGEDDGDVHYDEEDEEHAVLSYMDSGAGAGCGRGCLGSGNPASPPPPRRPSAGAADGVGDGVEPGLGIDLSATAKDAVTENGSPGRLSVGTPLLMYRRGTSSLLSNLLARESRPLTPTQTKSVHASPALSAKPAPPSPSAGGPQTTVSCQHLTTAVQSSSRRCSPHNRTGNQSPLQPSPLNTYSLSPYGTTTSTDEETRERQCKHLSLHEAFFFNQSRSLWLVDDQVLAKVLEYVRLMGYEHPALRRDRSKGQASLWSSSSAVSSPIALGKPKKKSATSSTVPTSADSSKETDGKTALNSQAPSWGLTTAVATDNAASHPSPADGGNGAKEANSNDNSSNPYAFLGKQYHLKAGKPKCAGQYANTTSTSATHLFLTFNEAMRWVVEQEYVIGTVLMCCARFVGDAEADGATIIGDGTADGAAWNPRRAMLQRGKPCIPVRLHPIHFVASLVLTHYPQWGGMAAFMRTWETQIHLVLGTAAPSHQRVFKCPDDGLILSSDLDSGNLHRVERTPEPYYFLIWLEPDSGSDKRIWFRFSVTGAKEGRTLRFRLMNAAPHAKLYRQNGMMPVWRDGLSQVNWGAVDSCSFRTTNHDLDGEVLFSLQVRNSTETIQIAFCAPYSYADLLCHVCHWHALVKNSVCDIRFEERVLCRSPEGRKLHLLILTSRTGGPPKASCEAGKKGENSSSAFAGNSTTLRSNGNAGSATGGVSVNGNATVGAASVNAISPTAANSSSKAKNAATEAVHGPYSNFSTGKKVILVSGRVHPGEVTASHGVHGLISFLLSSNPRAVQLREHFIFFIVPMLNPDGVSRGHSRLDQFGSNLNRCYNDPDPASQPTVLALRCVFEHLQHTYCERFIMYFDFHSHASQSSGFMFGNHLPVRVQHWNVFFPRLVELHARHVFCFGLCRFGRVHMTSKDGASRVLFGSSLIHSYTVELTHFTDRRLYADDFTAMNNGSEALLEVTWPPQQPPPSQATGNGGDDDAANSKNGSRSLNSVSPTVLVSRAGFGGRGGKRTSSSSVTTGISQPPSMVRGARRRAASVSAGAKQSTTAMTTNGKDEVAGAQKYGTSVNVERGSSSRSRDSASASAPSLRYPHHAPSLQPVASPSVLCQSAEVGKACLLALLDYCSIGRPSDELNVFGGMNRVLRDVMHSMKVVSPLPSKKQKKSQAVVTYAGVQPIYKQY